MTYCIKHYTRFKKYGDPLIVLKRHTKATVVNTTGLCTMDGCGRQARNGTSAYCEMHYTRVKRHGDAAIAKVDHTPARERWKTSYTVDSDNGCWNWTGPIYKGQGHGFIQDGAANRYMAHRYVWEQIVGPIAKGLVLDHLCKNKACVNPEHLEAVPQEINAYRGGVDGGNAAKTHCSYGHEYSPENTYITNNGWRACRACNRRRQRELRQRRG